MSVCIVPDRNVGLVAGFALGQPDLLPAGWTALEFSRRLRALNEQTFRERYSLSALDREWLECPEPVSSTNLLQIFRAIQDLVYNSNLAADRDVALILSSILGRAVELLPEGTGSGEHVQEVLFA